MKTLLVRPVLVATNKPPKIGDICTNAIHTFIWTSDHVKYNVLDTLIEYKNTKAYQLILISLDPDEKIEAGDYIYENNLNKEKSIYEVYERDGKLGFFRFRNVWIPFNKPNSAKKVIATQDQLSPELIDQLMSEYNNGGMNNFEIEMHNNLNDPERLCDFEEPYMSNGFVTVADTIIGKPLEDYINEKHSQDRCMGFIDGYNARKSEESISYTEEEVRELLANLTNDLSHDHLINFKPNYTKVWFNENKKK